MGFLDKAKENLERVAKQGQDKLDEVQTKKRSEGLLRDLGAWTFAAHAKRDDGKGLDEIKRLLAELDAFEAEHGPLGGDKAGATGDEPEPGEQAASPATEAHAVPPAMSPMTPPAPGGIVPPPPPMSEHGSPAGAAPPPPLHAPPPPPTS